MQDVEQQFGYEEATIPTENECANTIQNLVVAKREVKEPKESSSVDNQNFQLTSGEINQSQSISDILYADDGKYRSTPSLKNVGLWKKSIT